MRQENVGSHIPLGNTRSGRCVLLQHWKLTSAAESFSRIFDRTNGRQFDYLFNCGGETRFSQDDEVYKMRSYGLSMAMGKEAAKRKIGCYVESSTGMVYKPDSNPRKETDKLKPWSKLAKWKMQAEEDLAKIEGLNLVVMRMAHVYGPYTSKFLGTALCMARVYQFLGKEMRWLWKEDLRQNTVHVDDVSRALWTAAEWYGTAASSRRPAPIFNIVDHGNTCKSPLSFLPRNVTLTLFNSPRHHVPPDTRHIQHRDRLPRHAHLCLCAIKSGPRSGRGE
jgi:nucleoside-diphosphate-sugar epimerase